MALSFFILPVLSSNRQKAECPPLFYSPFLLSLCVASGTIVYKYMRIYLWSALMAEFFEARIFMTPRQAWGLNDEDFAVIALWR
jgi:hypothetical protein